MKKDIKQEREAGEHIGDYSGNELIMKIVALPSYTTHLSLLKFDWQ